MNALYQNRKIGPQRDTSDKASRLHDLVAALQETERKLRAYAEAEEERTQVRDQRDPRYSLLARSLRGRANNLRTTIATLETAHAA